jgi:hypothetical protein
MRNLVRVARSAERPKRGIKVEEEGLRSADACARQLRGFLGFVGVLSVASISIMAVMSSDVHY